MAELRPGVYEELLTRALAGRLPADERLYRLGSLDGADAPSLLARHLARILESVLRAPDLEGDSARQAAFCNQFIDELARAADLDAPLTETVDESARQLLEVLRLPPTPLAKIEAAPRPTIPLSQNALLVASKQEPTLAGELRRELASADRVDLLCAFVKWSGVRVLLDELRRARDRGVPIRVITTTYTGVTDARALDELAALGAQVRVCYERGSTRLHAKAWLFDRDSGFSTAYIGSSNLSHSALHEGLEWNTRLTQAVSAPLLDRFRATFETYWADSTFEPYSPEEFRNAIKSGRPDSATELVPFDIQPYPFQREMLYQLEVERKRHGRWQNLLVAATGTGKTVVSAFDYKRLSDEWSGASLLFVAHREEILRQSRATFRNVLHDGSFGELMVGGERPTEGRHVFASIQSLSALSRSDLETFPNTAYDVVIVDEFHHAEAPTYQRLLERLEPKVLLGMTATPERSDGFDIKRWFGGHVAVELRLWDALEQGLLCPFQYFGVADGVDLSQLRWRRGGYDVAELDRLYTGDDGRVLKVLHALNEIVEDPRRMRALGFCVSVKHAHYMADRFRTAGIPAVAVSAASAPSERSQALQSLRTRGVNVVFAVDLFNEGLDVPEIDTVMFLRPTESPVLFLQQLGRGLRRTEDKAGLTVLDFIGQQHQRFRFEDRYRALLGCDRRRLIRQIEDGFPYLPAGCLISLDRQSEKVILDNVHRLATGMSSRLSERLRELGDVGLTEFVATSGFSLEDIYAGSTPGWTAVRRRAGFVEAIGPDEAQLSKALGRMLHVDDPTRVRAYLEWLARPSPPEVENLPECEMRLLQMLHFDLWSANLSRGSLQQSLERLWENPNIVHELQELLELLSESSSHLSPEAGLEREIPLQLHTRYSRNELLAALGETISERPTTWREGVRWVDRYKMDVFLVTLNKTESHFSPSTRYRDYPVSPKLFHWESQSTTSEASATGQRYVQHKQRGSRVLLFVRASSVGDSLGASPFLFLGTASYVQHEGDRPMSIWWELDHEMPPDFFQAARVAA